MQTVPQVVDPRFAVGRGEEFSAAALREKQEQALSELDEFYLPMGFRPQDQLDTDNMVIASEDVALSEENKGFQMLQRMGWRKGTGLGRENTGIVEPIRSAADAGMRLGLGKMEEMQQFTAPENVSRKKLETEIQAEEDEERTKRREAMVEQQERIKQDVTEAKKTFYCEVCHKQYKTAMEMDNHLSSYDHHHTKRLKEMKAMTVGRQRAEKQRKEQKRVEKELAKLNAQFLRAQQQQQAAAAPMPAGAMEAAPPLPPDDPPPLPPDDPVAAAPPLPPGQATPPTTAAVSAAPLPMALGGGLSLGISLKSGRGAAVLSGKQGPAFSGKVNMSLAGRKPGASKLAAFAAESSDDEA